MRIGSKVRINKNAANPQAVGLTGTITGFENGSWLVDVNNTIIKLTDAQLDDITPVDASVLVDQNTKLAAESAAFKARIEKHKELVVAAHTAYQDMEGTALDSPDLATKRTTFETAFNALIAEVVA